MTTFVSYVIAATMPVRTDMDDVTSSGFSLSRWSILMTAKKLHCLYKWTKSRCVARTCCGSIFYCRKWQRGQAEKSNIIEKIGTLPSNRASTIGTYQLTETINPELAWRKTYTGAALTTPEVREVRQPTFRTAKELLSPHGSASKKQMELEKLNYHRYTVRTSAVKIHQ